MNLLFVIFEEILLHVVTSDAAAEETTLKLVIDSTKPP